MQDFRISKKQSTEYYFSATVKNVIIAKINDK